MVCRPRLEIVDHLREPLEARDHLDGAAVQRLTDNRRLDTTPGPFKDAMQLAHAKGIAQLSPAHLEGFAAARVLTKALRRAGPKPTREKIRAALETLRKFDIGGLQLTFTPDSHSGLDFTDLSIITTDGRFLR